MESRFEKIAFLCAHFGDKRTDGQNQCIIRRSRCRERRFDKKLLSCRREAARCYVSLNISLSHCRSLWVTYQSKSLNVSGNRLQLPVKFHVNLIHRSEDIAIWFFRIFGLKCLFNPKMGVLGDFGPLNMKCDCSSSRPQKAHPLYANPRFLSYQL